MKFLLCCLLISANLSFAAEPDELIKTAKLLLSDNFNRVEKDDSKEELGKAWITNSERRAKGIKQADLTGEALLITMAKEADHAVSVKHDAPFDDGIVRIRFKMHDKKGIKFNFNDPAARKVTWAGHISKVQVKPNTVIIGDDKTGVFDLKIRAQRQYKNLEKNKKAELNKFLKTKQASYKVDLKTGEWYVITIVNIGPKVTVWIDEKKIGSFESVGLDHKVKQNLAFGVPGSVSIDDIKIWSLDK